MSDKFRKISKAGIRLYLLIFIGGPIALFGLGALVALVAAIVRREWAEVPVLLVYVALLFGLVGGIVWLSRNAQKASKEIRRERGKPRPDGDMSDVAGIPKREPWLG